VKYNKNTAKHSGQGYVKCGIIYFSKLTCKYTSHSLPTVIYHLYPRYLSVLFYNIAIAV